MSESPISDKSPDAVVPAGSTGLFSHPGFAKLFFGSTLSKLADRLYQTAMAATALVVFAGGTGTQAPENQLSTIQVVATVPLFFAYFLMGALIDEADRRRLMSNVVAIKAVLVLIFVPFLWGVQGGNLVFVHDYWLLGLALIALIGLIDSPFSPARAAAVPDVSPVESRQLGASLVATSGLLSTLVGSLGFLAAQANYLGPAKTIIVAFACYGVALVLLRALPDAVAVPGIARTKPAETAGAPRPDEKRSGLKEYVKELREGFGYVFKTRGLWELVVFETLFWCVASAFYVVFSWFLDSTLRLRPGLMTGALTGVLCAAGAGLFIGALTVGKLSRRVTPIATYPLAFLVMGVGAMLTFSAPQDFQKCLDPHPELFHGDWVERLDAKRPQWGRIDALKPIAPDAPAVGVRWTEGAEPEQVSRGAIALWMGCLSGKMLAYLCFAGFVLGAGGGFLLGRVDADVLSIADEKMRGRVFSIKGSGYTIALIGVMGVLTVSPRELKHVIVDCLGPFLILAMIPAFIMSWFVDVGIWAEKGDTELLGALHRVGYRIARGILRTLFKIMFRYEVVGAENLPATGPVVLAANHASFIDPLLLGCGIERVVQYIMHSSYYRSFAHPFFRFLRCIPVDEKNQLGAIKAGVRSLNQGACIGIFPEGHVADDGKLQMPMAGALFLAQRSGALVIPAAIKGNYAAFPRHAKFPRFSKITVVYGKPILVGKDLSRKQVAELTDQLMVWLAQQLELEPPPKSADKERDRGERGDRGAKAEVSAGKPAE